MCRLFLVLLLCWSAAGAQAAIRLPALVASGMVLQQRTTVKLWGWAAPGEKIHVKVSWQKKEYDTVASESSNWAIQVPTPEAGGPHTITIAGTNKIELQDVLTGEVWLCAGQSNMDWSWVSNPKSLENELLVCRNDQLRFFRLTAYKADTEQLNALAGWQRCDSNSIKQFSAVGYYFGKRIYEQLNVPVGLIHACMPATSIEFWTPVAVLQKDTVLAGAVPAYNRENTGLLYNSMIAPLKNFSLAGALWYQGESDVTNHHYYAAMFTSMIDAWRKAFNQLFPFYFVQIAPYDYQRFNAAYLREAQAAALVLPATAMVVISDLVDDIEDQHPVNKKGVGLRLAEVALMKNYGQKNAEGLTPSLDRYEIQGNTIIVTFKDVQKKLMIKGDRLKACFVAGADQQFKPASGVLRNGQLVVWSPQVPNPVAVRYQFGSADIGNLFGTNGMPVMPFRTDQFE